jgi:putative ABC transport system permease protein
MLVGIAAISLLVGGIGIMNIMLVSVRERTREVGIRKSVGATRSDIALQFLIEAVTLSVCGGLIGVGIAWAATVILGIVYPSVPVTISLWSVLTAFLFSLSTGVFFGVYPATKASSVDPVEALRYE